MVDGHDPFSECFVELLLVGDVVVGDAFFFDDELAENFERIVQHHFVKEIHVLLAVGFLQILSDDLEYFNVNQIAR